MKLFMLWLWFHAGSFWSPMTHKTYTEQTLPLCVEESLRKADEQGGSLLKMQDALGEQPPGEGQHVLLGVPILVKEETVPAKKALGGPRYDENNLHFRHSWAP